MSKIWFISDTHFGHTNVLKYCNRPFKSIQEHDEILIKNWNSVVKPGDTIYHLGDFGFTDRDKIKKILRRLMGNKFFIRGNHDKVMKGEILDFFSGHGDYREIKVPDEEMDLKQVIVMSHYPFESWNKRHHGAWHLHGHCIDKQTEVLTFDGWKTRAQISNKDSVATVNLQTLKTEYRPIQRIVDNNFTGDVVSITGRNINARLTDEHVCVLVNKRGLPFKVFAKDFSVKTNRAILLSGQGNQSEYFGLSDDTIRLLVWIAADGSIENKNLVRFHLKKQRKIKRLTNLLTKMSISFSLNNQKSKSVKINFNYDVPYGFGITLKPITEEIRLFSKRQVDILVEEYLHTDGCKTAKRAFQISTSKKEEADLLQQVLVTNGYSCNLTKRSRNNPNHKVNYILSGNTKKIWQTTNSAKNFNIETVKNEGFWCLVVPNQTLIIRRNGMVHVTGNCHGTLPSPDYQARVDVGVDVWNYFPVSYQQIKTHMTKKVFKPIDHHTTSH